MLETIGAAVLAILIMLLVMALVCDVTDEDGGYWHSNL